MKKKTSLTLDNEFLQYCELNEIKDPEKLAKQVFDRGFSLLKYGETPTGAKSEPKIIEKEVFVTDDATTKTYDLSGLVRSDYDLIFIDVDGKEVKYPLVIK